jgi:hypothetical protein
MTNRGKTEPEPQPPRTNLEAMLHRHWGCLPALGFVIVAFVAITCFNHVAYFVYINAAYGRQAWADGLRVVNKQGDLSDGTTLSETGETLIGAGTCAAALPLIFGAVFGLTYLNMRRRRERLDEQLARWSAENATCRKADDARRPT